MFVFILRTIQSHPFAEEMFERVFQMSFYPHTQHTTRQHILEQVRSYEDRLYYCMYISIIGMIYLWNTSEHLTELSVYIFPKPQIDIHPIAHIDDLFFKFVHVSDKGTFLSIVYHFIQYYDVFLFEQHHQTEFQYITYHLTRILLTELSRHFRICNVHTPVKGMESIRLLKRDPSFMMLYVLNLIHHTILQNAFLHNYMELQIQYEDIQHVFVDILQELHHRTTYEERYGIYMEDVVYLLSYMLNISVTHLCILKNFVKQSNPQKRTLPISIAQELEDVSYLPSRIRGLWGNELTTLHLFDNSEEN